MNKSLLNSLALATSLVVTSSVAATDTTGLVLYRSDSATLFGGDDTGGVAEGHAVVHEPRTVVLKSGPQNLVIGGLPRYIDAESLSLDFDNKSAQIYTARLLLGQGRNAALAGLLGHPIELLGSNGQTVARGVLQRADDGLLLKTVEGSLLVRDYAAVRTTTPIQIGSSLELTVHASRTGQARAMLGYTTSGLGWRAAYVGTFLPGKSCSMQFESRASIANRSGRDWSNVKLSLIAGDPHFARPTPVPRMMALAAPMGRNAVPLPEQSTLDEYRRYALLGTVSLPNGSITQSPLYATRTLGCERTALYENGGAWMPSQPMLSPDFNSGSNNTLSSNLHFITFDSMPAGYLRAFSRDASNIPQLVGEARIDDTPKGDALDLNLGTAFDLRGTRERTSFHVDKHGRTLNEALRIIIENSGNTSKQVTVREHPNRWREWNLSSSSVRPSKQTLDTLEFRVEVPANGKAMIDYTVRYSWTAEQKPQN